MMTFSVNPNAVRRYGVGVLHTNTDAGREYLGEVWLRCVGALPVRENRRKNRGKPVASSFDVDAYAAVAIKNNLRAQSKRETPIITSTDMEKGERGVLEDTLEFVEERLDEIAETDEVEYAFKTFVSWRAKILREVGCDIVRCVLRALKGDKLATKRMTQIVEDFELQDIMFVLCNRPGLGERLQELC